jgi:hypothetical protein
MITLLFPFFVVVCMNYVISSQLKPLYSLEMCGNYLSWHDISYFYRTQRFIIMNAEVRLLAVFLSSLIQK